MLSRCGYKPQLATITSALLRVAATRVSSSTKSLVKPRPGNAGPAAARVAGRAAPSSSFPESAQSRSTASLQGTYQHFGRHTRAAGGSGPHAPEELHLQGPVAPSRGGKPQEEEESALGDDEDAAGGPEEGRAGGRLPGRQKRKVALWVGYIGTHYRGLQWQPGPSGTDSEVPSTQPTLNLTPRTCTPWSRGVKVGAWQHGNVVGLWFVFLVRRRRSSKSYGVVLVQSPGGIWTAPLRAAAPWVRSPQPPPPPGSLVWTWGRLPNPGGVGTLTGAAGGWKQGSC